MAHILMVEDDDIVAEQAAQVLIDAGHACGWVSTAEMAWKVLARRRPDLILLDQTLPGQNGTEFLRKLRKTEQYADLPVIMITSIMGFKEEQFAYFNGAQDYIRKPFGQKGLVHRVEKVLASLAKPAPEERSAARTVTPLVPATRRFC